MKLEAQEEKELRQNLLAGNPGPPERFACLLLPAATEDTRLAGVTKNNLVVGLADVPARLHLDVLRGRPRTDAAAVTQAGTEPSDSIAPQGLGDYANV